MKISAVHAKAVAVPVRFPVVSCVRETDEVIFVLVNVETNEGISGIAYAQAFNIHGARAIIHCVAHLESVITEQNVQDIDALWNLMQSASKLLGLGGLPMFALSMVDIALWDIKGKTENLPVYQLLGAEPGTFEVYQSDGLWLVSPQEVARQAETFAEAGFSAMKMRLGRQNPEEDLKAVREARKAIGDIELAGDVNQGWNQETSIEMAKQLSAYGLIWLEEPVNAEDVRAHAQLTCSLKTPIATGENLYGYRSMQNFLHQNAAAIYTPDLQRCGGITGWLQLRNMLEQHDVRCGLHLFPEFAIQLFPSIKNPVKMEWVSWSSALFAEPLACKNGKVDTPSRPGFGMEWDNKTIEKYAVV